MIKFENVSKRYPNGFEALKNINLTIEQGEFVAIIGLSGAGKSTLIRTINRMHDITEGTLTVDGTDVMTLHGKSLRAFRRRIGMIFQSFNLITRTTVIKNVLTAFVPDMPWWRATFGIFTKDEKLKALDSLDKVGILDKAFVRADQLSGGQQQRVALARALVIEPSVLLFDEPLSNLDAKLRVSMRTEIRRIQQEVGITAIYVTHDQSEAMALSDQIIIMNKGVVAQIGTPQEIYYHPVSEFVADFIGEANFLRGKMTGTENGLAVLDVEGERLAVAPREGMRVGEEYTVVLRPESAALSDEGGLPCTVELSCFMGSYQNYHVRVGNTLVKLAENDPRNKRIYRVGEQCHLTFAPDTVHVL